MGANYFARMPNIEYPRSKFKMPFKHGTTFNHGNLVPIDCFPVIPGDTMSLKLSSLIRMSTPIAPIMDDIYAHVHAFYVPMRLVWDKTEEFFGENKTSAGPQQNVYTIPQNLMGSNGLGAVTAGSLSHYLGKPINSTNAPVNILKERAYYLIWNEWYRAQQVQNPISVRTDNSNLIGNKGLLDINFSDGLLQVNKNFDYFTAATISPQYGNSVTLPLGSYAPLVIKDNVGMSLAADSQFTVRNADAFTGSQGQVSASYVAPEGTSGAGKPGELYADLSLATAATINSIRYAFAVQKYLERSNYGSRYFEVLKAHYGVTSPDARLQRPEYLGGTKFNININQVTSVAGYSAGVTTTVGETGAVSVTANKSSIFTKGFVEFGFVFVMFSTVHDQSYSQGVLREDFLNEKFEFYSPEFAHLGDQVVYNKEIMLTGSNDDDAFGYQEHWAELRYRPNRVSGLLDPNATGSLDYWTLSNKFSSRPSLSDAFIKENRDSLTRCLKTGATGPDYIGSFYFDYTATRELPVRGSPGLLDHVGNF